MNRSILALAILAAPLLARAQSAAPRSYQSNNGQYQATVATTPVSSSGTPTIPAYKGADGVWHAPIVTVSVCSVDTNGNPQLCPAPLPISGGTLTGVVVAGGGLTLPQGVPFVVQDAATAPASNAACVAGTTEFVAANLYRCITSGQWGRITLTTGY